MRRSRQTRPAGPGVLETLGIAQRFRGGSVEDLVRLSRRFGDITYLPHPVDAFVLSSAALIDTVLVSKQRSYRKSNNYRELRRVMGEGLVTSDGETWAAQRRQVGPAFRSAAIRHYTSATDQEALALAHRWGERGAGVFDLSEDLIQLSARLTNEVLFGAPNAALRLRPHILQAAEAVVQRIYAPLRVPLWLPTPRNRRERGAVAAIDETLKNVLAGPLGEHSLANVLRTREGVSGSPLRDQLVTLMLAGQDTLASALTWFFYCMARNPGEQAKVRRDMVDSQDGDAPRARAAFLESMRLFPPIPVVARTPRGEERLDGFTIPEGSVVLCAISAMHRRQDYWSEPDTFRTDRFLDDAGRPRPAYAPFASGPRKCIGDRLAMMQALHVISKLLPLFHFEVAPGFTPKAHTTITMSPANGLRLRLTRRKKVST